MDFVSGRGFFRPFSGPGGAGFGAFSAARRAARSRAVLEGGRTAALGPGRGIPRTGGGRPGPTSSGGGVGTGDGARRPDRGIEPAVGGIGRGALDPPGSGPLV